MIKNRRQAYTLIELAITMTVSSVLMVVSVSWIYQSMKFASRMRVRQANHESLLRIAGQFRDDVHEGVSLKMVSETDLVIETAAGMQRTITYSIHETSVSRVARERDGETVVARDNFPLAATSAIHWDTTALPHTIAIVVNRGNGLPEAVGSTSTTDNEQRPIDLLVRASLRRIGIQTGEKR